MTAKRFEALDGINTANASSFGNTVTFSSNVAIDTSVLFVNTSTDRVGVKKLPTQGSLDVNGSIYATSYFGDGSNLTGIQPPLTNVLVDNANNTYSNGRFTVSTNASFVFTSNSILQLSDDRPINFGTGSSVTAIGNTTGLFFAGSNVRFDSTTLYVDTTNKRVGVGNNAPTESLHVNGKIRIGTQATATTDAVRADRQILNGDGLSGGGNLTADRTLAVDATVIRTTGAQTIGGLKTFTSNTQINANLTVTGDINNSSDIRLKSNIETLNDSLNKVLSMRGVSYTKDNKQSIGLIAQEVINVIPEVVNTDSEYMSVAYGNLIALLIEAIKELNDKIDNLNK